MAFEQEILFAMKTTPILLAAVALLSSSCASVLKHSGEADKGAKVRSAQVSDQIDNTNYLIYKNHERLKAAEKAGRSRDEISDIEIDLRKLGDIKDHLEGEQFRILRELNGN